MQSSLYREPYEKGKEEGKEEGKVEGRREEKIEIVLRFLTKRFGILPTDVKEEIEELDMRNLDIILDKVLEYKDLEELRNFLN